jgi:tetratricopeptide (TPR) repeat protein
MFDLQRIGMESLTDRLVSSNYWPARAAQRLEQERFSDVVRICLDNLDDCPELISGRLIYATALYRSGQSESASEEFRLVLSLDPDNLVALKYLGDILYASGDATAALANYYRVLEIDPYCRGLKSGIERRRLTTTRTVTLTRGSEARPERRPQNLRDIPFFTETMGDLYLAQGYPRLATEVFRQLNETDDSPRIAEKLAEAVGKTKEKES